MSANNLTPYRIPKKNGAASAEVSNPKSDSDDAPLANIRKKKTPAKSSPDGQYGAGAEASAPKSKNKIKSAKRTKNSKASTESTPPVSRLKYIMDIISTPSPARTAHMPKTIDDGADRAITSCNATDSKVTNPSPGVTVTAQESSGDVGSTVSAITLPTEFTDKKTDMNIEKSINTPARHPPSSIRSESSEEGKVKTRVARVPKVHHLTNKHQSDTAQVCKDIVKVGKSNSVSLTSSGAKSNNRETNYKRVDKRADKSETSYPGNKEPQQGKEKIHIARIPKVQRTSKEVKPAPTHKSQKVKDNDSQSGRVESHTPRRPNNTNERGQVLTTLHWPPCTQDDSMHVEDFNLPQTLLTSPKLVSHESTSSLVTSGKLPSETKSSQSKQSDIAASLMTHEEATSTRKCSPKRGPNHKKSKTTPQSPTLQPPLSPTHTIPETMHVTPGDIPQSHTSDVMESMPEISGNNSKGLDESLPDLLQPHVGESSKVSENHTEPRTSRSSGKPSTVSKPSSKPYSQNDCKSRRSSGKSQSSCVSEPCSNKTIADNIIELTPDLGGDIFNDSNTEINPTTGNIIEGPTEELIEHHKETHTEKSSKTTKTRTIKASGKKKQTKKGSSKSRASKKETNTRKRPFKSFGFTSSDSEHDATVILDPTLDQDNVQETNVKSAKPEKLTATTNDQKRQAKARASDASRNSTEGGQSRSLRSTGRVKSALNYSEMGSDEETVISPAESSMPTPKQKKQRQSQAKKPRLDADHTETENEILPVLTWPTASGEPTDVSDFNLPTTWLDKSQPEKVTPNTQEQSEDTTPATRRRSGRTSSRRAIRVFSDSSPAEEEGKQDYHAETEEDSPEVKPRKRQSKQKVNKSQAVKAVTSSRGRKKKPADSTTEDEEGETILCQKCDFNTAELKAMKFHFARKHNKLYSKKYPEGLDDTGSLKVMAKLLGNPNSLTCADCGKVIHSFTYFRKHREWCTSDDKNRKTVCTVCDSLVNYFWLHEHTLACKRKKEAERLYALELEQQAQEKSRTPSPAEDAGGGRRKRKAATKAIGKIKDISSEKVGGDEAEAEADDISRMYSAPTMTLPTEEALTLWRTCLDNREYTLKCTHQGCTTSKKTLKEIISHYWTCVHNGLDRHTWNCKRCLRQYDSEYKMINHCKAAHQKIKRKRKRDEDDDEVEYKSGEDDSDDDDDDISSGEATEDEEESDEDEDADEGKRPRTERKGDKYMGAYSSHVMRNSFSTKDLCEKKHKSWIRLPKLLPERCRFSNSKKNLRPEQTSKRSVKFVIDSDDAVTLKRGESMCHKRGHTVYIGESISHIQWCPMDRISESDVLAYDQFAVISPTQITDKLDTDEAYSFPGQLYMWRFSELKCSTETNIEPYLTLTHNFGKIHNLKWCDEGGFLQNEDLGRIGLLAIASSDGVVHLASVPYMGRAVDGDKKASYSIDAELKLVVPGNTSQCLCVDWQKIEHKFLAAGFSDGSVSIWYISDESTSKTLHPIRVFKPHPMFVTAVVWCPFSPDHFLTSSHGWHIWDMKDLSSPYFSPKLVDWCVDLQTKVNWPRMHHGMVSCTDPSFKTPTVSLNSFGYENISGNSKAPILLPHYAMDVDSCDCSDIVAVCDVSGTVRYCIPIIHKFQKSVQNTFTQRNALQCKALTKHEDGAEVRFQYNVQKKQQYKNTANTCKVQDLLNLDRSNAINAVSLNPNASTHSWLLSGGTHGLLHVIKIDS